jgi:SAM-dependent methyltransferase
MRWVLKAAAKKALSCVPTGRAIDFFIESKVTKSLPVPDASLTWSVQLGAIHIEQLRKYGSVPIENAKFYEFGAGWDLIGPLTFYVMGARDQTLYDIAPNLKLPLINHSLASFYRLEDYIKERTGAATIGLPFSIVREHEISALGMQYIVGDMVKVFSEPAQFDYITSTSVLEHIPIDEIPPILLKCHELLTPGGLISFVVDMRDHYFDFDPSISIHNFLKYPAFTWDLIFNSSLHYQNRLRFPDYLRMIKEANFEIVTHWIQETSLNGAKIHPTMRAKYDDTALAACTLWVVGRRG